MSIASHSTYTPAPRPKAGVALSSTGLGIAAANAAWLYDECRAFPGTPLYAHSVGGTYVGGQAFGCLAIEYPQHSTNILWRGDIYKTAGRDTVRVDVAYLARPQGAHRITVQINGVTVDSFVTTTNNTITSYSQTYSTGPGSATPISADTIYTVVIFATTLAANNIPLVWYTDAVYGHGPQVPLAFTELPPITDLTPAAWQAVLTRQQAIYDALARVRRVGFSGTLTGFLDSAFNQDNNDLRHFHQPTRVLPGRRTLRISGRLEGRSQRTFRLTIKVNGSPVWSKDYAGLFVEEPWEPVADLSHVALSNGTAARIGIDYRLLDSARAYPRPRICLLDWAITGASSSPTYQALRPLPVGTPLNGDNDPLGDRTILSYLDQVRLNTNAAAQQLFNASSVLNVDWPWVSAWDTSARHMFTPGGDASQIQRRDENQVNGPACFTRWGDLLHIKGVRPRIVWGPQLYTFDDRNTARDGKPVTDEKVEVAQPYEYPIDDDPDKETFQTIHLGRVESNGATIQHGERFRVVGDRISYASQQLYSSQV
jgi:hypothetical protein